MEFASVCVRAHSSERARVHACMHACFFVDTCVNIPIAMCIRMHMCADLHMGQRMNLNKK